MKFHPIRIRSTPEVIVQEIIRKIESGSLKPGQSLPTHKELANMFQVGLGSIREAVKMLKNMGIVNVSRGRGTFIQS